MKLFKFINRLFSNSEDEENKKDASSCTEKTEIYNGLNSNKIDILLEKHRCQDQEDLVIALFEKEARYETFTEDEKIFYDDPEWELLKSFAEFGFTLNRERQCLKSISIKELIDNRYQIYPEEKENPYKEIINFTLIYFEKYFIKEPMEAKQILSDEFPTMHLYIKRQISNQNDGMITHIQVDEENAYNEFLIFCKNFFCSYYPDKSIRDAHIKNHFKVCQNDLIQFIDAEQG